MSHDLRINRRKMRDETEASMEGYTQHPRFSHATMIWVGVGSTIVNAGAQIYSSHQTSKAAKAAVSQQRSLVNDLKYEPIDIEALKKEATQTAIDNATRSLAIERDMNPDVAATRAELARQVRSELELGGNLSPDVVNRVTSAGRTIGATSGIGSPSTVPLTASLLGLTSMDLANQRRAAAAGLLNQNELPTAGLDPGAVAALQVAQNNAQNDFNMSKTNANMNLAESEQKARTAQIGGQVGMISSLANLLGKGAGALSTARSGVESEVEPSQDWLGNPVTMTPYKVKG